jgi:glutathione S-transferase
MQDYRWLALVTLGVGVLLCVLALNVGRARKKYGIKAPAKKGDPAFERVFRLQMNTLVSTVALLPAMWLFAAFLDEMWGAALGAVWLATRVWYAVGHQRAAAKPGLAFALSMVVFAVLTLGAAWGVMKGSGAL